MEAQHDCVTIFVDNAQCVIQHFSLNWIITRSSSKLICLYHENRTRYSMYCQVSNISRTLVGNTIADHSDVVGASPVGSAPTTYSYLTSYIYDLTRAFNGLGKDSYKARWETFKFCDLVRLTRYYLYGIIACPINSGQVCYKLDINMINSSAFFLFNISFTWMSKHVRKGYVCMHALSLF